MSLISQRCDDEREVDVAGGTAASVISEALS